MPEAALIKNNLSKNMPGYGAGMTEGDAFERFTAETILKRYGLTFDQIQDGIVDGQDDGGIDSLYMFVNRALIATDTEMDFFKKPVDVDLFVIQSKLDMGFKESAITKLVTALPQLMALDADAAVLSAIYNDAVCEKFGTYREKVVELAAQFPTITVHVIYATLAKAGNDKVTALVPTLVKAVQKAHPNATCKAELWDAKRLYQEAQKQNLNIRKLRYEKSPVSHGKGYVILAKLRDYYEFISDDGEIIDSLFEFNVRDYNRNASVNKEMGATLSDTTDAADFWWLNNGITILAEDAGAQDNALTIKNPLVVNGLQTSHEIYQFFARGGSDDKRAVQVRVLEIVENTLRDRVIKATNSQTGIRPASLHATEPFQRKIEDFLEQLGIYYDRRRDYWRNKGKSADSILGMERLAQSVIAVLLERPHDARGRPTTLMTGSYDEMFDAQTDLDIYKTCARLYFAVDAHFKQERNSIEALYRNNLRYHLMMSLAWRLNKSRPVHRAALGKLNVTSLKPSDIADELAHLIKYFKKSGATDKIAKDSDFTAVLKKNSKVSASSLAAKPVATKKLPIKKPPAKKT
ncbi:MAG: hypothetical protein JWM36_4319 [Hyphomicrobiales bacterium]|nr:hypothetical protein [Hyphomicrobiales bacterium]